MAKTEPMDSTKTEETPAKIHSRPSPTSVPLWASPRPLPAILANCECADTVQLLMSRPVLRNSIISGSFQGAVLPATLQSITTDLLFGCTPATTDLTAISKYIRKIKACHFPWGELLPRSAAIALHVLDNYCSPTIGTETMALTCCQCHQLSDHRSQRLPAIDLSFDNTHTLQVALNSKYSDVFVDQHLCTHCHCSTPAIHSTTYDSGDAVVFIRYFALLSVGGTALKAHSSKKMRSKRIPRGWKRSKKG